MADITTKTVFGPGTGGPSDFYRIPSMVTTKNGVTVSCADARYCSGRDNPNRIDKVVRRSTDSGKTWSGYILAAEEQGTTLNGASAAIDPVMVYVAERNRIYLLYCHTPAGVGILNSDCTVGEDSQGNKIIRKGLQKYLLKQGKLFDLRGNATPYSVAENGDVYKNAAAVGNIFMRRTFKEAHTSWLMICHSDDDGLTWSRPRSLNAQVKKDDMSFIGPGPGIGIVLKKEPYRGRIVAPIYYGTRRYPLRLSCCVIYSDDGGNTWTLGETPNNTRTIGNQKANVRRIKNSEMLTESQLIEQEDGTLKYFMRNHDKRRSIAVAYSRNGGADWEDFHWDDTLPQPVCQISVLKLENTEKPTVVLLNPSSREERSDGMVRLSEDDGETFPYGRMLKKGAFVYSALTQLPDGNIGAMYEPDLDCRKIDFASFSVEWIKGME